MRERRRQKRANGKEDNFAAQAIDLTKPEDAKYAASVITLSKGKSANAWDWYDKLGEIHYGVSRVARIGGYAELGVYKMTRDGEIGEQVTSGLAGEIGASLYSPYGGVRGLIERFLTLMKIPADSYLIQAMNDGEPDGFDFVSADELKLNDTTDLAGAHQGLQLSRITLPAVTRWNETGAGIEDRLSPAEFVGRVWRPSSRFVDVPDSQMTALNTECELLHLLTIGLRSKLLSRLASNGIFYIPSEVNDARSAAPAGEPGEFHQNKVLNELMKAAMYSARNPTAPEASMPIFMTGPGQHAEQFRHIVMDQVLAESDMKLRAELTQRILVGLDVQPSQVEGAQDSNHWSSWASSEDEIRIAVRPDLETMCWALTRLVLWKRMQDAGRKPGEIGGLCVWYDLNKATTHQNAAEDARQMADRLMLSAEATRRIAGFEERDAPDAVEYIRALGVAIKDPYLATFQMDEAKKFDWDKISGGKSGPAPDSNAPDSGAQPGKGNPGSPADNKSKTPARLRPA